MNDPHGREQIRKTTGWLYRANVTLSEVLQLLIHSYFEYIIQSKIQLQSCKWKLHQCD